MKRALILLSRTLARLLPFAAVVLVWDLAARFGGVDPLLLPSPGSVWDNLVRLTAEGILGRAAAASFYRLAVGYLLAVGLGVGLGALLSQIPVLRAMFEPLLSLLISVPTIAWVPALLVSAGLGDATVITTVFLGSFFVITYYTLRGIETVKPNLVWAARLMGLRGPALFLKVYLPGALVSIMTGLRLGIGYAWRALVGGEMLAAMIQSGLGKMVFQARYFNDLSVMLAGLVVIGLSGWLLDKVLLRQVERLTVERWGMLKPE